MTAFTLAHLSDPHVPPLPVARLRDLAGKRLLGYLNWTRKRIAIHRRDVLDTVVADLKAQAPDHIALTGDLVNLSLDAEFAPARRWLESVAGPADVSVVPGNHDAYVRGAAERFARDFADYVSGDDGAAGYPYLRQRGPLTLIGVSTSVPTAPGLATGWLGPAQLAALDGVLAGLDGSTFRVLLVHHPLQSAKRAKRMTDAPQLMALLARHGVDLVLHGHDHVHSTIWLDGPQGRIPVVGVASASMLAHKQYPAAGYNLFRICRREDGAWGCLRITRGIDGGRGMAEISRQELR